MYFESHAHYNDRRFDADRAETLGRVSAAGVDWVVNVGDSIESSRESLRLAHGYDFMRAAVGVHPHNACGFNSDSLAALRELCRDALTAAIGEIGLDFYYDNSPRNAQELAFLQQLELCREASLPVIVHSREADSLTFKMMRESGLSRGVIHCFSGDAELALAYASLGFCIGVGGIITYAKADKLASAVAAMPLEHILLETDCPYLAPVPMRGKRNSSEYLPYIAEKIAIIKGISRETVAAVTSENGKRLFLRS